MFQIMKWCQSGTGGSEELDIFLEIFANDFCKIVKNINMKRRVRGRDDIYANKMKSIEAKL